LSVPLPPLALSLPFPRQIRSLPPRPKTLSLPALATITSPLFVPLILSGPSSPTIVARRLPQVWIASQLGLKSTPGGGVLVRGINLDPSGFITARLSELAVSRSKPIHCPSAEKAGPNS